MFNRKLFWMAKQVALKYNFKFTWENSSGVFIKKTEGAIGTRVNSITQLMDIDKNKQIECLWQLS